MRELVHDLETRLRTEEITLEEPLSPIESRIYGLAVDLYHLANNCFFERGSNIEVPRMKMLTLEIQLALIPSRRLYKELKHQKWRYFFRKIRSPFSNRHITSANDNLNEFVSKVREIEAQAQELVGIYNQLPIKEKYQKQKIPSAIFGKIHYFKLARYDSFLQN